MSSRLPLVYVDTSALLSLFLQDETARPEREAARELVTTVISAGTHLLGSSELLLVEMARIGVNRGIRERLTRDSADLTSRLHMFRITAEVLRNAAMIPLPLRTLDALHVGTAMRYQSRLAYLLTHDRRMAEVSRAMGIHAGSALDFA